MRPGKSNCCRSGHFLIHRLACREEQKQGRINCRQQPAAQATTRFRLGEPHSEEECCLERPTAMLARPAKPEDRQIDTHKLPNTVNCRSSRFMLFLQVCTGFCSSALVQ
mmetsp:Transcript_29686/g.64228  ORF Transcript_29686/g.64228 Transcript_29686/m.64228 type:complete len:109 (-) Transcript_29686:167-493(-)